MNQQDLVLRLLSEHMTPPDKPPAMVRWMEQQGRTRTTPERGTSSRSPRRPAPRLTAQQALAEARRLRGKAPARPTSPLRSVASVAPRPEREETRVFGVPYSESRDRRDPQQALAEIRRLRSGGPNPRSVFDYPSTFPQRAADPTAELAVRRRLEESKRQAIPPYPSQWSR